jgi:hypothetical protein
VGLKLTFERTPAFAKGDSRATPAGGWYVSVEVDAPAGSSDWLASPTDEKVTTIRPCSL